MLKRLLDNLKQLGWLDAGLYAIARALAWLSGGRCGLYKYYFVAQPSAARALARGRGRTIEVGLCRTARQLPSGAPRPAPILQARFAAGALCLAASASSSSAASATGATGAAPLSGYLWLCFGAYAEDEVRARYLLPCPRSCWDFDVWVRPELRFGYTFPRLWDEAGLLMRSRAIDWSCSRISAFNRASLGAHRQLGAVALGSATFLRCGGWQWTLAGIAPYCHLSRHAGAVPQFSFDTGALVRPPSMEPSCSISKR